MAKIPARLEEHAAAALSGRPGAGMALGVVLPRCPEGELRFFGELADDGGALSPPGPSTLFELASLSKTFTAALFEVCLSRDPALATARCGDWRPPGAPPVAAALRGVPLRAIGGFTSGLPADNGENPEREPDYWRHPPSRPYTAEDLFRHAAEPGWEVRPPGTAYTYSSFGFALLAESLALAATERGGFPRLLERALLEPLGLRQTRMLDAATLPRMPSCFDRQGRRATPGAGGFPAHYGSAGIVTTPADLLAWLRFQMGYLAGSPFGSLLANLQLPPTALRTHAGLEAGRGLFLKEIPTAAGARPIVLKSGGLEAFVSFIAFAASPRPGILPSPAGLFALSTAFLDIRSFGVEALRILLEEEAAGATRRRSAPRAIGEERGDPSEEPRVYYGLPVLPKGSGHAAGGIVKFQSLEPYFPNSPGDFDVLCLVSSRLPADAVELWRAARANGARLLYNQAGAATPATHDTRWEQLNRPLRILLREADHVFYQSEFARRLADAYLGRRDGSWEILPNAVDTRRFSPAADPAPSGEERPVVLLGGTQYRWYRLEVGLRAFAAFRARRPQARLLVSGQLVWIPDQAEARRQAESLVGELGLREAVTFLGSYAQSEAPEIFRRAHVLLHPMFLDCCPTVVLEAMACGLPVVYGDSGGVRELVGPDAGIAVPTAGDFERHAPPEPEDLAAGLAAALADRKRLGAAGRQRAVASFDREPWIARYRERIRELGRRERPAWT